MKPKAVTFGGGNHIIYPDNPNDPAPYNEAYDSDQWYDHDGNGATNDNIPNPGDHDGYTIDRRLPVAYTRNTPMAIAEFEPWVDAGEAITGGPKPGPAAFMYRATHHLGGADETVFEGDYPNAAPAVGSASLPDHIDYNPMYTLDWEVSFTGGVTWFPIGSTNHEVYVTLNDPLDPQQHSIYYMTCGAADGAIDELSMLYLAWKPFASRSVTTRRGAQLGYYRGGRCDFALDPAYTPGGDIPMAVVTAKRLLAITNGQCGAWADLFARVLRCQGLPAQIVEIAPDPVSIPLPCGASLQLLVNNYSFSTPSSPAACPNFPHRLNVCDDALDWPSTDCTLGSGVPGQDSPNPPSRFDVHYLVATTLIAPPHPSILVYFDPSYGTSGFATPLGWSAASLAGFAGFAQRINPALPPGELNPYQYGARTRTPNTTEVIFTPLLPQNNP